MGRAFNIKTTQTNGADKRIEQKKKIGSVL